MKKLLSSAKVTCSEVKVMDFLKVKVTDQLYKNVKYAIVDPSCSGSGMVLTEVLYCLVMNFMKNG